MNDDRGYGALPKLYGAPAYARPPVLPVNPVDRPFDPDDLPLEAERAREDHVPGRLPAPDPASCERTGTTAAGLPQPDGTERPGLVGRAFRLRPPGRGREGQDPSVGE